MDYFFGCSVKVTRVGLQISARSFLSRAPSQAFHSQRTLWKAGHLNVGVPLRISNRLGEASERAFLVDDSAISPKSTSFNDAPPHIPVLLKEVAAHFDGRHLRSFVDCTLGAGGHAAAIISGHPEMEMFLGMDVDPVAHEEAHPRLQRAAAGNCVAASSPLQLKLWMRRTNFRNIKRVLQDLDPLLLNTGVDGILMDLGMSSMQVNAAGRGFSFMKDGPADMRMDPTATENAQTILNTWPEAEIQRILRDYGDERRWKYLARKIVETRLSGGISSTSQLVQIIGGSSYTGMKGKHGRMKAALHPATRTFQALRIAVNDELKSLELALSDAFECLSPGGRLQVISFHSLEDRIVKQSFLTFAGLRNQEDMAEEDGSQEYKHIPGETRYSKYSRRESLSNPTPLKIRNVLDGKYARVLTKRPIVPNDEEMDANVRSRSAKLRVLEKK